LTETVDFTFYCRNCKLLLGSLKVKDFKCPECGCDVYIIEYFFCSSCKKRYKISEAVKDNFKCEKCGSTLSIMYDKIKR